MRPARTGRRIEPPAARPVFNLPRPGGNSPGSPSEIGHRSPGNQSDGIASGPSGAPENHFPPYEDVRRRVITRARPLPAAPAPPAAVRPRPSMRLPPHN
ncbi:hypothetical protein GCM10009576_043420 [Streptomyces rhizosphaericus]|uniref:Uncharacterized protein n=2 Tax=Streptomyces rhizosphaericus TaxID=114699 RepID=A0ABN1SC30_9ACTN